MWFKSLKVFQFVEPFSLSVSDLTRLLEDETFSPVSSLTPNSIGWVKPLDEDTASLVHSANGFHLMSLKIQEKIIPMPVLRERMAEKIAHIEKQEGRRVYRKEKETIKEEIYHDMLAHAFAKSSHIHAYIDTQNQWLVINTASQNKAELFLSFLRKTLGSLKVEFPQVATPSVVMTQWLKEPETAGNFQIDHSCVFEDADDEGGVIRCTRQDLLCDTIQNLLNEGKYVTQLGLTWNGLLSLVLKDDFSINAIKSLETLQEQANEIFTESKAQRFDADFVIMTQTLADLLTDCFALFKAPEKTTKRSSKELEPA